MARGRAIIVVLLTFVFATAVYAEDLVELTSGAKVRGKVKSKTDKGITVDVLIGPRTFSRVYPLDKVAAVTIDGKREAISGAAGSTATTGSRTSGGAGSPPAVAPGGTRSKADVEALINQLGKTPPDWFEATPLNYPQSLDLTFPQPPPGGWNNQKNVGQYVWDIINPNENKWREGVRLMHDEANSWLAAEPTGLYEVSWRALHRL